MYIYLGPDGIMTLRSDDQATVDRGDENGLCQVPAEAQS